MPTVLGFLKDRLASAGVDTIFGLPGDYILNAYKKIDEDDRIQLVNATDEAHAGFAADAYARVHGIGCVCVTYNVGALKCLNPIAGAYAERSPVVVLVGSPGIREREEGVDLHHTVRSFATQQEIFSKVTCDSTVLSNPQTAAYEIDRVLMNLKHYSQPVYIELPRDIADKAIGYDVDQGMPKSPVTDPINLEEAIDEVTGWIAAAKNPVILAGVELARCGLGDALIKWAEKVNIPICTEILSKSVVGEKHPLFAGVYSGASSPTEIRDIVEKSDCILMLGVILTDMVLGSAKPRFALRQTVWASIDGLTVKNHNYDNVGFRDFCGSLFASQIEKKPNAVIPKREVAKNFEAKADAKLTTSRLFEMIQTVITKDSAIITDIGVSLFGAMDLQVDRANAFISPAYYTSMGMAIPGAVGISMANPSMRPVVIVGDGAFQMTVGEISTMVRLRMNPIVFVINNRGFTTERFLLEGRFNDVANWNYHEVDKVFGGGQGFVVKTEQELQAAVAMAIPVKDEPVVINVLVEPNDVPPALERITAAMSKKI